MLLLTLTFAISLEKGIADEKIKIGLLVPLTGENSEIGQSIIKSTRLAVNKINNLWGSANDIDVYIAGGGAAHYQKAILRSIPHAKLMQDSFYAVALGMMHYLSGKKEATEAKPVKKPAKKNG